jgi:hypothetical protein
MFLGCDCMLAFIAGQEGQPMQGQVGRPPSILEELESFYEACTIYTYYYITEQSYV